MDNKNLEQKTPPNNEEAEHSLLGGLMLDPESWDYVSDALSPKDFYRTRHNRIYTAIQSLQAKTEPIDIITVSNWLNDNGQLEAVGGTQYLAELIDQTPSSANITSYAKIIREKSVLRQLIHAGGNIVSKAFAQDYQDFEGFLGEAEGEIFKISQNEGTDGLTGSAEIVKTSMMKLEELFHQDTEITGVASGFEQLDALTAGFHGGEMSILAARPSMGKTAFSLNIATFAALAEKKTVAYFSVEMAKEQLMMRLLAQTAKINMSKLRVGKFNNNDEWPAIINAAAQISKSGLYIDDTSGISPFEIRAKCRRLKTQKGLDMIMVDYLQLMKLKRPVDSREREVAEISSALKAIAKELNVPVIALAQLNRGVEGRAGKDRRPMLSDLRESGSIEQDADVIMMLFREEYYERDNPDLKGQAEVIIGKHRNGPTGTVKLHWRAEIGQFENAVEDSSGPHPPLDSYEAPNQFGGNNNGGNFSNNSGRKPKNFAPGT